MDTRLDFRCRPSYRLDKNNPLRVPYAQVSETKNRLEIQAACKDKTQFQFTKSRLTRLRKKLRSAVLNPVGSARSKNRGTEV
jgi:hypothetical protein